MKIWWINQADCEAIGDKLPQEFPTYVRNEYRSLLGRAGRGRLWVDAQFGPISVDPWPDTPLAKVLGCDYGGIVIKGIAEIAWISKLGMPGIVTDLELRRCLA